MKSSISRILISILGLCLLFYSGLRSVDFVQMTVPADKQFLAYFAIASTELGMVFWLATFLYGAEGAVQRGLSLMMVVVDFCGAVSLFSADTLIRSGEKGIIASIDAGTMQTLILALSIIVAINIGATLAFHIFDPEARKKQAAEEAMDQIEELALKKISASASVLASELAPQMADDWLRSTRAKYLNVLSRPGEIAMTRPAAQLPAALAELPASEAPVKLPAQRRNGHVTMEMLNSESAGVELEPDANPTPRRRTKA